jgi:amphi-Trp domain-containing protein
MKTGKVVLSSADEYIEMHPSGLLSMSLKAKRKGNNNKIGFKIQWKEVSLQEQNPMLSVGK